MKKILSILLVLIMIVSSVSLSAFAGIDTGSCGTNLTWSFDTETGVFDITGYGAMKGYTSINHASYSQYIKLIKTVNLPKGITSIGDFNFFQCNNLSSISIPKGVVSIGFQAFRYCSNLRTIVLPENVTLDGLSFGNTGLRTIVLPRKCTLSSSAFEYTTNVTDVFFAGTKEEVSKNLTIGSYNTGISGATNKHYCEVVTTEATCTTPGAVTYMCMDCDASFVTEETPRHGPHL